MQRSGRARVPRALAALGATSTPSSSRGWFSLHSAANHQLIGRRRRCSSPASPFRTGRARTRWLGTGKALLEREALAQVAPDGVNREQALGAQRSRSISCCCACSPAAPTARRSPPNIESRVEAMLDFLASLLDAGGNLPLLGDRRRPGDAATPTPAARCSRWARCCSGAATSSSRRAALDDSARWLLGPGADAQLRRARRREQRLPPRQAFPEGGYFFLGCGLGGAGEMRAVADAGPLGYRAAAHGHADALSFTLSAGGRALLVDPGACALSHAAGVARLLPRHRRAQHGARRRRSTSRRPTRRFDLAAQGAPGVQPVAVDRGEGQLRGLARRLHAPARPGEAPAPDRARQAPRAAW